MKMKNDIQPIADSSATNCSNTFVVGSTIILGDCIEVMKQYPDKAFDLAVVDPPYGINMSMGHKGSAKRGDKNRHKSFAGGDVEIPNKQYFAELKRISKNQIVWGANYMIEHLEPTPCFIVWDKLQPEAFSMAMCEIAWSSFDSPAKVFKKVARGGFLTIGTIDQRIHPTQKPVYLYEWIFKNFAKQGDKILDTHLGSGSSRIAADKAGLDFTGIEIDKEYFEASDKRFKQYKQQLRMEF